MTMMLAPDLLDRRGLALLAFVDGYGRAVDGPVQVRGDGVQVVPKGGGRYALTAATGFETYASTFDSAPAHAATPVQLDCTPASRAYLPRRFKLQLPRDADPAHLNQAGSLFQPVAIELLAAATAKPTGSAVLLRVSVKRSGDGRAVEHALVRAQTDNGLFAARALTDARGEAVLLFPVLPLSFAGAGATVDREIAARVIVDADPAVALFHSPAEVSAAARDAAMRTTGHPDPDALAAALPANFPSGTALRIAAGRQLSLALTWTAP
ncbi:hypothetical protein E5A73_12770 [Sphingomonas gei]|uniref:Uncharacterized protein n=1 Tax=Sphingomonas gei TaxID=1395960 RepID=A0A4S1XDE0_9SPHN|nr:hypothetical protein [Sphingomonas gei]TGX53683.1 hypothetical protein E5A73_12770 [Sphingomonas gei]